MSRGVISNRRHACVDGGEKGGGALSDRISLGTVLMGAFSTFEIGSRKPYLKLEDAR
jgi:hypothetical protein